MRQETLQMLSTPVSELGLQPAALETVSYCGIKNLAHLLTYKKSDFLDIRDFGDAALNNIDDVIRENGFEPASLAPFKKSYEELGALSASDMENLINVAGAEKEAKADAAFAEGIRGILPTSIGEKVSPDFAKSVLATPEVKNAVLKVVRSVLEAAL